MIVGFNVTSHGAGYTSAPTVTIAHGRSGCGVVAGMVPGTDYGSLFLHGDKSNHQPDQQSFVYHERDDE